MWSETGGDALPKGGAGEVKTRGLRRLGLVNGFQRTGHVFAEKGLTEEI